MKKALIILLSLLTLVFMASSVLAADVDASGKVEVKWGGNNNKAGGAEVPEANKAKFSENKKEATLKLDLTKDYGDGVTAGLNIKAELHKDLVTELGDKILHIDGAGWIKLDYDLFAVTAKTAVKGTAAKDLGRYDLADVAGVQVDVKAIDGLTLTGIVNGGSKYNFLAKAEYSADALTVGGGIQKHGAAGGKDTMGVWGSYEVMEGLKVSAEYASRTEFYKGTAILGKVSYAGGGLTADAAFMNQKEGFTFTDKDDAYKARDWFQSEKAFAGNPEGNIVYVDASYALTDDLKVNGSVDYILGGKIANADIDKDRQMSYKVGANYALTEKIALEGWFKGYNKATQFGGKGVYTFATDVTGTLEVTSSKPATGDSVLAYSVVLSAAL